MTRGVVVWLMVGMLLAGAASASQGGRITREEALAAVFPGAVVEAERVFLTEQQMAEIAEIAGVEIESGLVARYIATRGNTVMGRAYVDTHVVRTKRESLLIALEAGRVRQAGRGDGVSRATRLSGVRALVAAIRPAAPGRRPGVAAGDPPDRRRHVDGERHQRGGAPGTGDRPGP